MSWTKTYWDIVDHLYWAPQYLGLKSIPKRHWTIDGDIVSVPKKMTNAKGPLYRRVRSGDEFREYVHRQEETFNHIFDLTFSVLPGDVVGEILNVFTSAGSGHAYESFGRDLVSRYAWGEHDNITTPDGFFVAKDSVLAVELKFNAKTSSNQLAKYVALFVLEEMVGGQRDNLDLLYIFNSDPVSTFEKQIGVSPSDVGEHLYDELTNAVSHGPVQRVFIDHESAVRSVLERLKLSCVSWQDFSDSLVTFSDKLNESRGDRTLKRLVDGLANEIDHHPLSNVRGVVREYC